MATFIPEQWEEDFEKKFGSGDESGDFPSNAIKFFFRTYIAKRDNAIITAFGGCDKCYGKGYSTNKVQTSSRYGTVDLNPINLCSCDRGKQIKQNLKWFKKL